MVVITSLATAAMSPAGTAVAFSWFFPRRVMIVPIRSSFSLEAFQMWLSGRSVPEKTRKKVRRPMKGSARVLKTSAARGPSGSGASSSGLLPWGLIALMAPRAAGEGR